MTNNDNHRISDVWRCGGIWRHDYMRNHDGVRRHDIWYDVAMTSWSHDDAMITYWRYGDFMASWWNRARRFRYWVLHHEFHIKTTWRHAMTIEQHLSEDEDGWEFDDIEANQAMGYGAAFLSLYQPKISDEIVTSPCASLAYETSSTTDKDK